MQDPSPSAPTGALPPHQKPMARSQVSNENPEMAADLPGSSRSWEGWELGRLGAKFQWTNIKLKLETRLHGGDFENL